MSVGGESAHSDVLVNGRVSPTCFICADYSDRETRPSFFIDSREILPHKSVGFVGNKLIVKSLKELRLEDGAKKSISCGKEQRSRTGLVACK